MYMCTYHDTYGFDPLTILFWISLKTIVQNLFETQEHLRLENLTGPLNDDSKCWF